MRSHSWTIFFLRLFKLIYKMWANYWVKKWFSAIFINRKRININMNINTNISGRHCIWSVEAHVHLFSPRDLEWFSDLQNSDIQVQKLFQLNALIFFKRSVIGRCFLRVRIYDPWFVFCNAAVCTSCYSPMEGQRAVNFQTAIFGVCVWW